MQDRLISGTEKPEDHFDRAIRPTSLADYIGQPVVREQMEILLVLLVAVVKHSTIH